MTYIPEEKISEIISASDIIDVISDTVSLKKSGRNYTGLCPFHTEKTPSFNVNAEKQMFYCFGCGAGGNIFHYLMKKDGLSFLEAVRLLAKRYGIQIITETMTPAEKKSISQREKLLELNELALTFFRKNLINGGGGRMASAYLTKRGMTHGIIEEYAIGFAPASWNALTGFLLDQGVGSQLAEQSGLIIPKKMGGYYDRFRNRIIFPIFNNSRQVIGFGGRVMDDALPKYLNSPETQVYHKSKSLYGLHVAKQKCRESRTVFIVEGYFDVLSLAAHGIANTVATLGTALTFEHVRMLKGHADKMILVYDSDAAGIKAALRSIDIFIKASCDARILVLPPGHDPDSYVRECGPQKFLENARNAYGLMEFLISSAIKTHGLSIEGKVKIIAELTGPIVSVSDPIARSLYIRELAERIDVDETAITAKMQNHTQDSRSRTGPNMLPPSPPHETEQMHPAISVKGDRLEQQMLRMMIQFSEIIPEMQRLKVLDYFENDVLKSIGELIFSSFEGKASSGTMENLNEWIITITDEKIRRIIASFSVSDHEWTLEGGINQINQFILSRKKQSKALVREIRAAESNNKNEIPVELLMQKQIHARNVRKRFHQTQKNKRSDERGGKHL